MRRNKNAFLISELIQKKFKREPFFIIKSNWEKIAGSIVSKNAHPIKIHNNILILKVKNHSWLQELILSKNKLLNKIKTETKDIKDIKFTLK